MANYVIRIKDGVDPAISKKLGAISAQASSAGTSAQKLAESLSKAGASDKLVMGQTRIATAFAKASATANQAVTAIGNLTTAHVRGAAQMKVATEATAQAKLKAAQIQIAADGKVAQAVQRTAQVQLQANNIATKAAAQAAVAAQKTATAQVKASAQAAASASRSNDTQVRSSAQLRVATERTTQATLRLMQQQLRGEQQALRYANAQKKAGDSVAQVGARMIGMLTRYAAVAGIAFNIDSLVRMGDAYTNFQNKLSNVSTSQANLNKITEEAFNVAVRTRVPVEDVAKAFARFDLALKPLGKSQEDVMKMTETINQMLVLGGATTGEASAGLLQLSQAFNKGKLDGDEFRSVMELMPAAADAIAKQLKVTRGELLELAPQGVITAKVMSDALESVADETLAKFKKMTPTIGQSLTVMGIQATRAFGEFDKAHKITETLARSIIFLSDHLDKIIPIIASAGTTMVTFFGIKAVQAFNAARTAAGGFMAMLAINPVMLLVTAITAAVSALVFFSDQIMIGEKGVISLQDYALAAFQLMGDGVKMFAIYFGSTWNEMCQAAGLVWETFVFYFNDLFGEALKFMKKWANTVIGLMNGVVGAIAVGWNTLPMAIEGVWYAIKGTAADTAEAVVNFFLDGFDEIIKRAQQMPGALGVAARVFSNASGMGEGRERWTIDRETRGPIATTDMKATLTSMSDEITKAMRVDYIGDAAKDIATSANGIKNIVQGSHKAIMERANQNLYLRNLKESRAGDQDYYKDRPVTWKPNSDADKASKAGKGAKRVKEDPNLAGDGSDPLRQKFVAAMRSMVGLGTEAAACARIVRTGAEKAGLEFGETKKAFDGASYGRFEAGSFFGTDVSEFKKGGAVKPGDLVAFKKTYGNWGDDVTHVATVSKILSDGTKLIIDNAGRMIQERRMSASEMAKIVGYATPKALLKFTKSGGLTDQEKAAQKLATENEKEQIRKVGRIGKSALGFANFESGAEKAYKAEVADQLDAAQMKDVNLSLRVNQELYDAGLKSLQQYRAAHHVLNEELSNNLDPMREYNENLKIEEYLLTKLGDAREVEERLLSYASEAFQKGAEVDIAMMRQKLTLMQQLSRESAAQESILQNSSGSQDQQFKDQLNAMNQLAAAGKITPLDKQRTAMEMLGGLGVDTDALWSNFELQFALLEQRNQKIQQMRQADLDNEKMYAEASKQLEIQKHDLILGKAGEFFGTLATLSKSENKKLAAIGKAAAIAQATINTYQAATKALTQFPPPFSYIAAAATVAAGMASVQSIRSQGDGFMDGGYTGRGPRNAVAGVVHGQEFVMNADATRRIGVDNLQALQTGMPIQGLPPRQGPQEQKAPIVNAPTTVIMVPSREAALAALKGAEGEVIIMETIERNGGTIAKVLGSR